MENIPIYCCIQNVFKYIKEVLKQVWVTLCRTAVFHHRNKLWVCSNSKLDDLKEFYLVRLEKKRKNFLRHLDFFLQCRELSLKKLMPDSCRTDVLYYCQRLLTLVKFEFHYNIDIVAVIFQGRICSLCTGYKLDFKKIQRLLELGIS